MANSNGGGFGWFLAGLGVGAVVGVLYAPQSGGETRDVLLSKAQEGGEAARDAARRAKEQASNLVDRGGDVLNQQKERFRTAYDAGRQAYNDTTSPNAEAAKSI